jgi:serine/threonine protein kinase
VTTAETTIERVGAYRVVRKLATGGTSDVLLAKAEGPHGFERTVVLKLLLAQFRNNAELAQMFAREASAYARLSHPAIVQLFDFFSLPTSGENRAARAGQLCMVLEYVDGPPLSRLRSMLKSAGKELDDKAAIYVASRIFAALAAAHAAVDDSGAAAPVIHRDVNPSNVLVPWDAQAKLADFGVAKVAGLNHQSAVGMIKGTYGYMAPEQVTGDPVTPRADVYAAAIILWELLTKRRAFQRGALPEIEALRAMAEPRLATLDSLRPDLDPALRDAVKRALEPRADKRAISAEEMVGVLGASVTIDAGREQLVAALASVRNSAQTLGSLPPGSPSMTPRPPGTSSAPLAATVKVPRLSDAKLAAQRPPVPGNAVPPPLPSSSRKMAAVSADAGPESPKRHTASARLAVAVPDGQVAAKELPNLDAPDPGERELPTLPTVPLTDSRGSSAAIELGVAIDEVLRGQPSSMPPSVLQSESARPGLTNVLVPPPTRTAPAGTLIMTRPRGTASDSQSVERIEVPAPASPNTERMAGPRLNQTLAMPARPDPRSESEIVTASLPAAFPAAPSVPEGLPVVEPLPPPEAMPEHAAQVSAPPPRYTSPPRRMAKKVLGIALALFLGITVGLAGLVGYGRYQDTLQPDATVATVSAPPSASSAVPVAVESAAPSASVASSESATPSASAAPSASVATSASAVPSAAPSASVVASASAAPSASVVPTASAAPVASNGVSDPEGTGTVKTAGAVPGRRIFVDEKTVGQTPESVTVKCGSHMVRLGSSGKPQKIDVPCGGEITVSDKF